MRVRAEVYKPRTGPPLSPHRAPALGHLLSDIWAPELETSLLLSKPPGLWHFITLCITYLTSFWSQVPLKSVPGLNQLNPHQLVKQRPFPHFPSRKTEAVEEDPGCVGLRSLLPSFCSSSDPPDHPVQGIKEESM